MGTSIPKGSWAFVAVTVLLAAQPSALAAKVQLGGKTIKEVVEEAERTGVVQRALRGLLLLKTVTGTLHVRCDGNEIRGATLETAKEEAYDFHKDEKYRCAILATRHVPSAKTYVIPADADHVSLIRPYMDGKRVEAQFQLARPGGTAVADVRFIDVLRGQPVRVPPEPPARRVASDRAAAGRQHFVGPDGDDAGPGTRERPFKTIKKGASVLRPGDTLYLRGGRYHEEVELSKLKGEEGRPITISGYGDEKAVIDGSEDLDEIAASPWARHDGAVWKRRLTKDAWQLWREGRMLMVARWPKITKNWTEDMDPRFNGRFPEPGTAWNIDSYFARFDPSEARSSFKIPRAKGVYAPDHRFAPTEFDERPNVRKLAVRSLHPLGRTNRSFVGAVVEGLGGGPAVIARHQAGADGFEVVFGNFAKGFAPDVSRGRFVIKNHLACLDTSKEWAFDAGTRTVYVRLASSDSRANHRYRAKTVDMVLRIRDCANITISKIDFFACALSAINSPGTLVEGCTFSYPTYDRTVLVPKTMREGTGGSGRPRRKEEAKFIPSALMFSPGGTLRDCVLRYYQSSGVEFQGPDPLIENCHLHHGTAYGVIFTRSPGATARRNTIDSTLADGAIRIRKTHEGRFTSELNYGYDFGTWRSDASGTQVQSGSQKFHVFRMNWFHHSECKACRFDGQPAGSLGTMVANVGWRLWQGLQVKGDYQKAFNNTFFECGLRCDISVVNQIAFGGGQHSITRNNLCDRISGSRTSEDLAGEGRIPGYHSRNWNGLVTKRKARSLLRDPDNFDFRPRGSPEIVDAGTALVDDRFVPGSSLDNLRLVKAQGESTWGAADDSARGGGGRYNARVHRYLGKAPDVGAYEYGDRHYWIPGRQVKKASFAVPPDGARYVKLDADLMWLEGKDAVSHEVYFGTDRDEVARSGRGSPAHRGSFTDSNIFTPPGGLTKDVTYHWRVDAVEADGTVRRGDVCSFLPCDGHYTEYTRIAAPTGLRLERRGRRTVVLTWQRVDGPALAGYNVYRRWGNPEYVRLTGVRLTPRPLTGTTFTDATIDRKGKFFYVVEAVDRLGVASFEAGPVEVKAK